MPKTALEKLREPKEVVIKPLPDTMGKWAPAGALMVISTPAEVDSLIQQIPKGQLASIATLKEALRLKHETEITCPMTTGIFVNISMQAAFELEEMGGKDVTPWWRVLKSDGKLNEKTPGGVEVHKSRLEAEGWEFEPAGKKNWRPIGYEDELFIPKS